MEEITNPEEATPKKRSASAYQSIFLIGIITAIVSMPAFIVVYKYIPVINIPIGNGFRIDHILTFGLIYAFFYILIKKFRLIVFAILILGLVVLTITNFSDIYTLKDLYADYKSMLYDLSEGGVKDKFKKGSLAYSQETKIRNAIDYTNEDVIEFARNKAVVNFQADANLAPDRRIPQYFSVFKEIRRRWIYVFDPRKFEYFADASKQIESLQADDQLKGDCDDYSILMAASIKAIGGEVRLVRTTVTEDDKTTGHIYPEVKVGKKEDLETIIYLIKNIYFNKESKGKKIHYYTDSKGFIWLNFDYNDEFPGNEYQSDVRDAEIFI